MANQNVSIHPSAVPSRQSPQIPQHLHIDRCEAIIPTGPQDGVDCRSEESLNQCAHCGLKLCSECWNEFPCYDSATHKHEIEQTEITRKLIPLPARPDFGTVMCAVISQITRRAA